jgi:LDH2 family malate/lactate/ureidoglycolate dehydrogenase
MTREVSYMGNDMRVSEARLQEFVERILTAVGLSEKNASITASVIVEADLRGVDSHGVRALGARVADMEAGRINATAAPELIQETGATALFDGHHGYGPFLCATVLEKAIEKAKTFGIGMVLIKNSSHWGCPAYYSRKMARDGFVGIAITNTNPAMPLWGASVKSIGNNPLTIAVPRKDLEPIVLDMAMQQIAWGKLGLLAEAGKKVPGLWGYDMQGTPTDDPREIIESGRVRPMGDYKGSGLAVMLEVLTGILSSGSTCYELGEKTRIGEPAHYSQTFIAIRPDLFMSREEYYDRVEVFYRTAKASPVAYGVDEILLPGDRSNSCMLERRRNGIPLTHIRTTVESLANKYNVCLPWS